MKEIHRCRAQIFIGISLNILDEKKLTELMLDFINGKISSIDEFESFDHIE